MNRCIALTVMAGLGVGAAPGLADRYYVDADADGANTGASWADAFTDLQSAIAVATVGDEVWVAEGTYLPSAQLDPTDVLLTTADPRDASFLVRRGASFYGGFAGTEAALSDRAGLYATTVLSGDVGAPGDDSDNAYRVTVFAPSDEGVTNSVTVLDGFTIAGGFNDVEGAFGNGAGMLAKETMLYDVPFPVQQLVVRNCTFEGNVADHAGALYLLAARVDSIGCVFRNNTAQVHGGAVASFEKRTSRFVRCLFEGNAAGHSGGAYADGSDGGGRFVDCEFRGNSAAERGGAAYLSSLGDPTPLVFVNCLFHGNAAGSDGGVLFAGGGFSNPPLSVGPSHATFKNCTLADNTAGGAGGGVFGAGSGSLRAVLVYDNSIIWGNDAPAAAQFNTGLASYCCVPGWPPVAGSINTDPRFIDPANGVYRVEAGSPVVDAGSNALLPNDNTDQDGDANVGEQLPWDIDSAARRVDAPRAASAPGPGPVVDMGAYEVDCPADMDADRALNAEDVTLFAGAFLSLATAGDLDGDGDWDLDDLDAFVGSYTSGCGF